jgi:hypothetical protein
MHTWTLEITLVRHAISSTATFKVTRHFQNAAYEKWLSMYLSASSKNSIGRPSAKLTVQLLPILAIAVALKLAHLNLGKRERSRRRQAWTEECEGVSGECYFAFLRISVLLRILRSAIWSFFSSLNALVRLLPASRASGRLLDAHA